MRAVSPPYQYIGRVQNLIRESLFRLIQSSGADFQIIRCKCLAEAFMNPIGIDFMNDTGFFPIGKFVPNCDSDFTHLTIFPPNYFFALKTFFISSKYALPRCFSGISDIPSVHSFQALMITVSEFIASACFIISPIRSGVLFTMIG